MMGALFGKAVSTETYRRHSGSVKRAFIGAGLLAGTWLLSSCGGGGNDLFSELQFHTIPKLRATDVLHNVSIWR